MLVGVPVFLRAISGSALHGLLGLSHRAAIQEARADRPPASRRNERNEILSTGGTTAPTTQYTTKLNNSLSLLLLGKTHIIRTRHANITKPNKIRRYCKIQKTTRNKEDIMRISTKTV